MPCDDRADRKADRKADRMCCDGRCTNGQACPAQQRGFAPGVIDGPARRRWWGRSVGRALRSVGRWAWPWATLGVMLGMALAVLAALAPVVWRLGDHL